MPDGLSALQRHCLSALEVDVYLPRAAAESPAASTRVAAAAAHPSSLDAAPLPVVQTPGPVADRLILLVGEADRSAPLVSALALVLGAEVQAADAARPVGAVLVSIGEAAPDAALSLPPLASLRGDPQMKQRSWLKIRSFLRMQRTERR